MVLWVDEGQLDRPGLGALVPGRSAAIWMLVWAGRPAGPPPPQVGAPVLLADRLLQLDTVAQSSKREGGALA